MESALGVLIAQGPMGAVAVLAIGAAIWAFRALYKEMRLRVEDRNDYADKLEALAERDRSSSAEHTKSIDKLAEGQRAMIAAIERNTAAYNEQTRMYGIREALKHRSGDSGATPAVRPQVGRPYDPRSER